MNVCSLDSTNNMDAVIMTLFKMWDNYKKVEKVIMLEDQIVLRNTQNFEITFL